MTTPLRLLALAGLAAGCTPSQNDPARYGEVHVGFSSDWSQAHTGYLQRVIDDLNALGPRFVYDPVAPQVVVRRFESPDCNATGAGRFDLGSRDVWIDPVCTGGELAFRFAAGHELMHWYLTSRYGFAGHICRRAGEAPDCHPTIRGVAMLNPGVTYGEPARPGYNEAFVGDPPAWYPQQPDLDLVRALREGL